MQFDLEFEPFGAVVVQAIKMIYELLRWLLDKKFRLSAKCVVE